MKMKSTANKNTKVARAKWTRFRRSGTTNTVPDVVGDIHMNNRYIVVVREFPDGMKWLSICTVSRKALHDWRDFQRIKNELAGPDLEAVELYPAETRLVDTANQYHLWCLPKGQRFPFGMQARLVSEISMGPDLKQRKWEHGRPRDLTPRKEFVRLQKRIDDHLGKTRPTRP